MLAESSGCLYNIPGRWPPSSSQISSCLETISLEIVLSYQLLLDTTDRLSALWKHLVPGPQLSMSVDVICLGSLRSFCLYISLLFYVRLIRTPGFFTSDSKLCPSSHGLLPVGQAARS